MGIKVLGEVWENVGVWESFGGGMERVLKCG